MWQFVQTLAPQSNLLCSTKGGLKEAKIIQGVITYDHNVISPSNMNMFFLYSGIPFGVGSRQVILHPK